MKLVVSVLMLLLLAVSVGIAAVPASIVVTPDAVSAPAGSKLQFKAAAFDVNANPVAVKKFIWSVSPATAGTISTTGKFTAKFALGGCTVRAAVGDVSGTGHVTIVAGAVKKLTISPAIASMHVGAQSQFVVTAKDAYGNAVDTTTAVWTTKAGTGLTVDASGLVTAGSVVGKFASAVRVTLGTKTANAAVTVTPVPPHEIVIVSPTSGTIGCGEATQFIAEARDEDGKKLEGQSFVWTCSSWCGKLSTKKGATTVLTASKKTATGTISVLCTLPGSPIAQMSLNIVPGDPQKVVVTGPKSALAKNQTFLFTAKVTDAGGNVLSDAPLTWQVTNSSAGSINADTGLFTAGSSPGAYKGVVVATATGTQITGSGNVTISGVKQYTIRTNDPGENYAYSIVGSGALGGDAFTISGGATITFEGPGEYDNYGNLVSALRLGLNITLSAQGESESDSATARQYYTQASDGSVRIHGSYMETGGSSASAWIAMSPGYQTYLASPMYVGLKGSWSTLLDTGDTLRGSYSVKGVETITVPLGTYSALKTTITPGLMGGSVSQATWFAPEQLGQAAVKISGGASSTLEGQTLSMKLNYSLIDELPTLPYGIAAESQNAANGETSPLMQAIMNNALDMLR